MFQKAIFFDYTETEKGAWFKVYVPGWFPNKKIIQKWMNGIIKLDDGRSISSKQNKFIHAMIGDIALYLGYGPADKKLLKEQLKYDFAVDYGIEPFSVAKIDMTTANNFIDYLINFMISWDVEFSNDSYMMAKDTNNWVYYHIMNAKCVCCGKDYRTTVIHLHHHENLVGMGRNRNKIDHSQSKFLPLCRFCHPIPHTIGHKTFGEKYHIDGIKLSKESLVELRLMNKCDLTELEELEEANRE